MARFFVAYAWGAVSRAAALNAGAGALNQQLGVQENNLQANNAADSSKFSKLGRIVELLAVFLD